MRNIATDVLAALVGTAVYIVVTAIMLLACVYCRMLGKEL